MWMRCPIRQSNNMPESYTQSFHVIPPFLAPTSQRCLSRKATTKPAWRVSPLSSFLLLQSPPSSYDIHIIYDDVDAPANSLQSQRWDLKRVYQIRPQNVFLKRLLVLGGEKNVFENMLKGQLLENGSVVTDGYGTMSSDEYRSAVISVFYYFHEPSKLIVLSLYCVVFLLAAVSNLLVIVVIFRYQHLHRLVVNLNDFKFTFIVPIAKRKWIGLYKSR